MSVPRQRTGFSLVLSLSVMALLVLVILSLAGLLSLESRSATARLAATQGRLAAIASLRLAMAHLQQEAGADRRVTARADLTADATQPGWTWSTIRNPLWTGVWRADVPQQPPSWLISGRHDRAAGSQSVSLSNASDYSANQWLPWQATEEYEATVERGALPIPLVGNNSATPHELATSSDAGRPDGRITLPRISAPDAGGLGYAYWIGDEGIKARVNLHDARHTSGTSAYVARGMLTGSGRAGVNAVPGFDSLTPDFPLIANLTGHAELGLPEVVAKGYSDAAPTGLVSTSLRHRRHRHDLSFWSQGLPIDSFWGGLKIDLSQAFEMTDADFLQSEFGEGPGGATLLFYEMNRTTRALPPVMEFLRAQKIWMPIWVPQNLSDATSASPYRYDVAALYTHNWHDPDDTTRGYIALRGPTWLLLRDYHRLYKQVEWPSASQPTLRARTFWPNVVQNERMQPGVGGTFHYSHIFNRMDIPNNGSVRSDPFVNDLNGGAFQASSYSLSTFANTNGPLGSGCPSIKPVRVAATPYISRVAVVFGVQQQGAALRLVCTPVVVLHNPFNVSMALRRMNATDSAAARLSFRWWNSWIFDFSTPNLGAWNRSLLQLAQASDSTSSATESLRTYIPETVLGPGEFKIFTPPANQPIPFARVSTTANTYDFNGGFWLGIPGPDGTPLNLGGQAMTVGLRPQGAFYIRHLMTSWPGDSIMEPATGWDGIYNRSSEHTELFDSEMQASRNGTPGVRTFPVDFTFPTPGSPPQIFAVIDYSVRWPRDPLPYPIMTHSNPLAMMTRGDANGFPPSNPSFGNNYATSSPSYRLNLRSPNTWGEAFEPGDAAGERGLGGLSNTTGQGGQTSAVLTAVPLRAPQSLAEYAHANLTMRDQDPLFTIGSGFASPNIPLDKVVHYRATENWTDADRTYLANLAIWDRYFLSSIAPEVTAGGSGTARSLQQVLNDFLDGTKPLANARMQLWRGRFSPSATVRTEALDWNKVAGHLAIEGAFNINSTSVDAWTAVLAATKGVPNGGDNSADTRFARTERAGTNATATPRSSFTSATSWSGFSDLDDNQIRLLARCIVDEIRFRTQFPVRTPVDRQLNKSVNLADERRFRGATSGTKVNVPTPFLGLSQFVNRFLDTSPTAPGSTKNTQLAQAKVGCLQAAISRAEADGGQISNRTAPAPTIDASNFSALDKGPGQQSWSANPAAIESIDAGTRLRSADVREASNQAHAALFAPGSLLQQDILAAIGSHISARSDTFVIRAYGDIRSDGGEMRGRAWIEAVVQRTPEYCVANDAVHNDPALLRPINKQLGRRFRIVSARWLRPDEI